MLVPIDRQTGKKRTDLTAKEREQLVQRDRDTQDFLRAKLGGADNKATRATERK